MSGEFFSEATRVIYQSVRDGAEIDGLVEVSRHGDNATWISVHFPDSDTPGVVFPVGAADLVANAILECAREINEDTEIGEKR